MVSVEIQVLQCQDTEYHLPFYALVEFPLTPNVEFAAISRGDGSSRLGCNGGRTPPYRGCCGSKTSQSIKTTVRNAAVNSLLRDALRLID